MTVTKLALLVLCSLVVLTLVKKHSSGISAVCEIGVVIVLVIAVLPEFKGLVSSLKEISSIATVSQDILKTMLKAFAILTVGGVVSDVCRDNGENALAGVVETVVKILAIACAIPIFSAVLVTALTLLE